MRCQAEGSRKGGKTPEMGGKEGAGRRRRRGRRAAGEKGGEGADREKRGEGTSRFNPLPASLWDGIDKI